MSARAERFITIALCLYCAAIVIMRLVPSFFPYVAETDWKQWVWEYHRYHTAGAFAPGHVVTDYSMSMQTPVYWLMMAPLSEIVPPIDAAIFVNFIAFVGALLAVAWAVSSQTTRMFGAAAAALLAHDTAFHVTTWGGYPRSFGPTITLLFLALWLRKKHWHVLALFVVGAGLYPSVIVPCALAYAICSLFFSGKPNRAWLIKNATLVATGVPVAVLSLWQSVFAPAWYGAVVKLDEAKHMPALGPHGRFPWLPFASFWPKVWSYIAEPFAARGLDAQFFLWPSHASSVIYVALMIVSVVVLVRKRALVWQPFALVGTSILTFWVARVLAFQLYLPHRMVQHVLPYAFDVIFVLVVVGAARALFPAKATQVALGVVLSIFVVAGDGIEARGLKSYAADKALYEWIDANTPIGAQFAGNLQPLDEIPLFAKRIVFVNWKMAHPLRAGYYAEMERRILAMYDAYYANDIAAVVAFCAREKIDYLVVDETRFDKVEKGDGQLFEPLRTKVVEMFDARKARSFALHPPPADAVVFHEGVYDVVDVAKLTHAAP